MKVKNLSPWGALHPVLFFAGVYIVALIFSIFICSSLFYSCNVQAAGSGNTQVKSMQNPVSMVKSNPSFFGRK